MTAQIAAKLAAEGKIALDEPVQQILPELAFLREPIRVRTDQVLQIAIRRKT